MGYMVKPSCRQRQHDKSSIPPALSMTVISVWRLDAPEQTCLGATEDHAGFRLGDVIWAGDVRIFQCAISNYPRRGILQARRLPTQILACR